MEGEVRWFISPELSSHCTSAALPFVWWSFSNDKWPDVKLSVTYQPTPSLLSQRDDRAAAVSLIGVLPAMGEAV